MNVSGQAQEDIEADLFPITESTGRRSPDLSETFLAADRARGRQVVAGVGGADSPYQPEVRIDMSMSGTRRNGSLQATADGTLLK